jgi:hypothetical protein
MEEVKIIFTQNPADFPSQLEILKKFDSFIDE